MSFSQQLDAISLPPGMRTKMQNHLSRLGHAEDLPAPKVLSKG
jgi:hypothetical protein